jgi:hypothetical protein
VDTKTCRTCVKVKNLSEYYRNAKGVTGFRSDCKACLKDRRRAEYVAGSSSRSPDASYEQVLKRDYGITLADYNAMLRKQANRCAICCRAETIRLKRTGELRRLAVDHDHVTGAVRGLLCHRCNVLVWALEDNHTSLAAIGTYIEEFRTTFANGAPL